MLRRRAPTAARPNTRSSATSGAATAIAAGEGSPVVNRRAAQGVVAPDTAYARREAARATRWVREHGGATPCRGEVEGGGSERDSRALDARGRVRVGLRLRAEQHRRAGAVAAAAERRRGGLVRLCEPLRRAVEARGGRLRRGVRAERQRQRRVVGVAAAAARELDGSRALAGPRRLRCGGRRDIVCVGRTERGYETRGERRVRVVRARRVSI